MGAAAPDVNFTVVGQNLNMVAFHLLNPVTADFHTSDLDDEAAHRDVRLQAEQHADLVSKLSAAVQTVAGADSEREAIPRSPRTGGSGDGEVIYSLQQKATSAETTSKVAVRKH